MQFEGDVPVYIQIVDLFYMWIVSGELKPGNQIPPVRKLAADLNINPNTVQKSLQLLDEQGITIGEVGRGRFITSDVEKIEEVKHKVVNQEVGNFIKKMKEFKLANKEILDEVEKGLDEPNVSR